MTEHLTVGHVKLSHNKNEIAYLIQEALSKLQILQPLLVNCIHLCEFSLNGSFLLTKRHSLFTCHDDGFGKAPVN